MFPLPLDPDFRRILVQDWLLDVEDRLELNEPESAEQSWKIANEIYLSLPPGEGDEDIETALVDARVKLNHNHPAYKNAHNF